MGSLIRAARVAASLSQSELSELSGIPKPTLSRYENDHVLPSLGTLRRLATALRVPEAALIAPSQAPEQAFYLALRERGIRLRSVAEAERVADVVAEVMHGWPASELARASVRQQR